MAGIAKVPQPKVRSRAGGAAIPLDDDDKKLMNVLQSNFPLQPEPWADIAGWAVDAARAIGDRPAEAELLNFLGWAQYRCVEDTAAGLDSHQRALAVAIEIGDRREQAWALGNLGAVLKRLGRLVEALDHNRRSTTLFTELDHWPGLNSTRNSRGAISIGSSGAISVDVPSTSSSLNRRACGMTNCSRLPMNWLKPWTDFLRPWPQF